MTTSTQKRKHHLKVLAFDGAKVHDFLFHVAMAQVWWQDLKADPRNLPSELVQAHRARNHASKLYDMFLEACRRGPRFATEFLARQHQLQRSYLAQSQPIWQSLQASAARRQLALSEAKLGFQAIKSAATVAVAIGGLLLVGPAGALITIGFDIAMELVKRLDHTQETGANTVVIGFKQTMLNDTTDFAGETESVILQAKKAAMLRTLAYPGRSSAYREVASMTSQLDWALRAFGVLAAGVTIYTEARETYAAFEEMKKAQISYSQVQSTDVHLRR